MNVFSHITVGRYLYKYFTKNFNIELDQKVFVSWNALPDVAPGLFCIPHFKSDIYDLIMERADYLAKNMNTMPVKEKSKQLGILCHFMADFFCYAHADYFIGSKFTHFKYELKMQLYAYRRRKMIRALSLIFNTSEIDQSESLYNQINRLHDEYTKIAPSYGVDFVYTLTACVDLMIGIVAAMAEEAVEERTAVASASA